MRFEPIDINKHRDYIIPFLVNFGTDEDFGDEEEYLDWVRMRSNIKKIILD